MFLRIATLALAQAIDLATFAVMVGRRGPMSEANPVVLDLYHQMGMPAVALAKLALVALIAGLVLAAAARDRRGVWAIVGGVPLALAIAAGLIGGITNASTYLG
jgi:hypothetical protein